MRDLGMRSGRLDNGSAVCSHSSVSFVGKNERRRRGRPAPAARGALEKCVEAWLALFCVPNPLYSLVDAFHCENLRKGECPTRTNRKNILSFRPFCFLIAATAKGSNSFGGTTFTVINSIVGGGVVALPFVLRSAGLVLGTLTRRCTLSIAAFVLICLFCHRKCTHYHFGYHHYDLSEDYDCHESVHLWRGFARCYSPSNY